MLDAVAACPLRRIRVDPMTSSKQRVWFASPDERGVRLAAMQGTWLLQEALEAGHPVTQGVATLRIVGTMFAGVTPSHVFAYPSSTSPTFAYNPISVPTTYVVRASLRSTSVGGASITFRRGSRHGCPAFGGDRHDRLDVGPARDLRALPAHHDLRDRTQAHGERVRDLAVAAAKHPLQSKDPRMMAGCEHAQAGHLAPGHSSRDARPCR